MQRSDRISLNAIRVFALVAQRGSIALASAEMGVTASAVSHQIKALEGQLGAGLFVRGNNSIALTDLGRTFLEDVTPGLRQLAEATDRVLRDDREIDVAAPITLAVRWLIPALQEFRRDHPDTLVRVATFDQRPDDRPQDVTIRYRRPSDESGETLIRDLCCPVLSPALLATTGYRDGRDLAKIPALSCTPDNWDWHHWAELQGVDIGRLRFGDHFDIDDAALRAAVAGLGMVLAPAVHVVTELRTRTLVPLPGFPPAGRGRYTLSVGNLGHRRITAFQKWLLRQAEAAPQFES